MLSDKRDMVEDAPNTPSGTHRANRGRPNWFIAWPFEAPFDDPSALDPQNVPPKVRVFTPGDRHVTALFLGGVSERSAHAIWAKIASLEWAPIEVQLGAVRMLGGAEPSAVSALIATGADRLVPLMQKVPAIAAETGWSRTERWAPLPHLTVARIQRSADPMQRAEALEWAKNLHISASATLDRLALYTWSMDRSQSLFARVAERTADQRDV